MIVTIASSGLRFGGLPDDRDCGGRGPDFSGTRIGAVLARPSGNYIWIHRG